MGSTVMARAWCYNARPLEKIRVDLEGRIKSPTLSLYLKANITFFLDTWMILSQWHVYAETERGDAPRKAQTQLSNQFHSRGSQKKEHIEGLCGWNPTTAKGSLEI